MTLYIYRVGWTYPARNPVYISKSMKNPSRTRTLPGPVRPVGPCWTGHSASTGQTARPDRLDRLVPILAVNNILIPTYSRILLCKVGELSISCTDEIKWTLSVLVIFRMEAALSCHDKCSSTKMRTR